MLTGNNSILQQATKTKEETKKVEELEQVQMAVTTSIIEGKGTILARELEKQLGLKENSLLNIGPWEYEGNYNCYKITQEGVVSIITNTVMSKDKFKAFANNNTPSAIIFTNAGASNTSNDIGEEDGEIYAWMDESIMYVSAKESNRYVQAPKNCESLFFSGTDSGWQALLTNIDCQYLDTSKVTNMSQMFKCCSELISLDISDFNTFNVTNMAEMFRDCKKIVSLNLSNFYTSKVNSMTCMFYRCTSLEFLDISTFDTSNVTDMSYMFSTCINLKELDVSKFDTSKVTKMNNMFASCRKIAKLNLNEFNTSLVTTMQSMFLECEGLSILDISSFDTFKVVNTCNMFMSCLKLNNIYVGNKWSTSIVTSSNGMFTNCSQLPNWNSSYTDKTYAFAGDGGYLNLK